MLALYLISFLIGGVLVALSAFGGADADADADFDMDADADIDADADADADADGEADGHGAPVFGGMAELLPLASLRFWTFFLAFGGLLGASLTLVGHLGAIPVAAIATFVGYAAGLGISTVVRRLKKQDVSSTVTTNDCIGASGRVLLPVNGAAAGQVRVAVRGRFHDFMAETDEGEELAIDDEVLVYDVRDDGTVLVSRTS